jgi:hypothetical protein
MSPYAIMDVFWGRQSVDARGRVDILNRAFANWLRMLHGQVAGGSDPIQSGLPIYPYQYDGYQGFRFSRDARALAYAGHSSDKIRFHDGARGVNSLEEAISGMLSAESEGDGLFVLGARGNGSGDSIPVQWTLDRSSPNELALTIGQYVRAGTWLAYSDDWAPGWTAEVDGVPAPVYRGNVAYKAIELPAGARKILFRYEAPFVKYAYAWFAFQSLLTGCAAFGLVVADLRRTIDGIAPNAAPEDSKKVQVQRAP